MSRIKTSPTLMVLNRAAELIAQGIDVIDFGPGEPDFMTPDVVCAAAKRAIDDGLTKYTNALGTNELRDEIAATYNRRYDMSLTRANVITGSGGKQELFNVALALVSDGDEVIIPSPYWVSFPDQVQFAGGTPVFVDLQASNGFRPTLELIENAFSDRTRGVILNSPSNPTGAVIEESELERIIEFSASHGMFVVFDETYEFFVYDGSHHVSAIKWFDRYPETIIVINSMSKTFAMTGWRLGYAVAHPELIAALGKIQSHSTSNPTSISQHAALEALRSGAPEVQ
jgi:aspartate aminotransferase